MWDIIHDRTHMRGDLPFDPFMIKQRMPFFLYSLEELRCDLTAFRESVKIERSLRKRADAGECLTAVESQLLGHAKLRAVRGDLRPHLPLRDHGFARAQLRRTRRSAAVRVAPPAARASSGRMSR